MKKLCKPLIIKCKEHECILYKSTNDVLHLYERPHSFPDIIEGHYQLILISLDENEKIEECWCINKNLDTVYFINKSENGYTPNNDWYKIIASTDVTLKLPQLSPEYIQQFIEEYNRGEVKDVEIEFWDNSDYNPSMFPDIRPKLTNEFVTIISKEKDSLCNGWDKLSEEDLNIILPKRKKVEEPITYTEEEVKELIDLAWATASAYGEKTNQADCDDWFIWNKKK